MLSAYLHSSLFFLCHWWNRPQTHFISSGFGISLFCLKTPQFWLMHFQYLFPFFNPNKSILIWFYTHSLTFIKMVLLLVNYNRDSMVYFLCDWPDSQGKYQPVSVKKMRNPKYHSKLSHFFASRLHLFPLLHSLFHFNQEKYVVYKVMVIHLHLQDNLLR